MRNKLLLSLSLLVAACYTNSTPKPPFNILSLEYDNMHFQFDFQPDQLRLDADIMDLHGLQGADGKLDHSVYFSGKEFRPWDVASDPDKKYVPVPFEENREYAVEFVRSRYSLGRHGDNIYLTKTDDNGIITWHLRVEHINKQYRIFAKPLSH